MTEMDWENAQFLHKDWVDFLETSFEEKKAIPANRTMFSSIASSVLNSASSLLSWGSGEPDPARAEIRVQELGGEMKDWMYVCCEEESRSRSSSISTTDIEDKWEVEPPPVFISTESVPVISSPLEDLFIEHPSKSVYAQLPYRARTVSQSGGGDEVAPSPSPPPALLVEPSPPREVSPPPRQAALARPPLRPAPINTSRLPPPTTLVHQAQKMQINKENKKMNTKYMKRANKVKDVNKRNSKSRRADRQKNHSGANNNRKPC